MIIFLYFQFHSLEFCRHCFISSIVIPFLTHTSSWVRTLNGFLSWLRNICLWQQTYMPWRGSNYSEAKLCEDVTIDTAATTLALAEQHQCFQLKAVCLQFIASPEKLEGIFWFSTLHSLFIKFASILNRLFISFDVYKCNNTTGFAYVMGFESFMPFSFFLLTGLSKLKTTFDDLFMINAKDVFLHLVFNLLW